MSEKCKRRRKRIKRTQIEVEPSSYQPSKAEQEADISIPTTPAKLARAVMRDVDQIRLRARKPEY